MAQNHKQKWEDTRTRFTSNKNTGMTSKSLETEFSCLPELEVPETLEAKLLAAIPDRKSKVTQEHRHQRWGWGFATAAAAVVILSLIFGQIYNSSGSPKTLIDINDTLIDLNDASTDLNDMLTRHLTINPKNTRIEETKLCNLQWSK